MTVVWVGPLDALFERWLVGHYLDLWEDWQIDAFDRESAWEWAEHTCPDVLSEFKQQYVQEETNVRETTETS